MPWGDGTGPWWAGGNWMCRGGFGRGYGRGMGRGRYWAMQSYGPYQRYTPYAPAPSREEEKAELKECVMELEAELKEAKRRISELEGSK